jgi:hypothetical protein
MDMRIYYRKLHEMEETLPAEAVVVISLETPDGGKAGVMTEVSRRNAAKLLMDGRASLASDEETLRFREGLAEAKRAAEQLEASKRMQVTVVPSADWQKLKGGNRPGKD